MVVHDIDRPDVLGVPPKMLAVCEQAKAALAGSLPYLTVSTDDNLCSSVVVRGALEPREQWANGIFQNASYFIVFIRPEKGRRYYEEGAPVTVEITGALSAGKYVRKLSAFRKYTGPVAKVIAKVRAWIDLNVAEARLREAAAKDYAEENNGKRPDWA